MIKWIQNMWLYKDFFNAFQMTSFISLHLKWKNGLHLETLFISISEISTLIKFSETSKLCLDCSLYKFNLMLLNSMCCGIEFRNLQYNWKKSLKTKALLNVWILLREYTNEFEVDYSMFKMTFDDIIWHSFAINLITS